MKTPVHIQTKFGLDYYLFIHDEFNKNKESGLQEFFRDLLNSECNRTSKEIDTFLDSDDAARKHKMHDEDIDGWNWYKGMSDKYSILNYYRGRK
jgi:hypothetical protein